MSAPLPRRRRLTVLLAAVALLAVPAAAYAGTIRYTVAASPLYTIQDNGNGIVKVTYNGCVVAGARQTLSFQMLTSVSADANATFNVLKEEGENPTATFDPASVFLQKGADQTFQVRLAFTLADQNNGVTTFRIKLDPESGEGLGQGAGIMVNIPCVLAAPASSGGPVTVPTAGRFPAVGSAEARGRARCVSVPRRLRLHAHQRTHVRVAVAKNGQRLRGSLVRATGPGILIRRRTNARGIATFTVRPSRKGTLVIQSDACFGAARVAVLGAVAAGRFTG
jgi:hypothetical protein